MAVISLPALSQSYPAWDWTASNGNATAAQTATGYSLLTNFGQTRQFSRHVWNDIVDCTAALLTEIGVSWDNSFGTAAECKITATGGELTAARFNGVAANIARLNIVNWKWRQNAPLGAVGRNLMHGVSEYGHEADFVFGWLIIELTDQLNYVISVLKGNENTSDLAAPASILTIPDAELASDPAGILLAPVKSRTYPIGEMETMQTREGEGHPTSRSYGDGVLTRHESGLLTFSGYGGSIFRGGAERAYAAALDFSGQAQTIPSATLTPLVFVGYMDYHVPSLTYADALLEVNALVELIGSGYGTSYGTGEITFNLPEAIEAIARSASAHYEALTLRQPLPLIANPYSRSISLGTVNVLPPLPLLAARYGETIPDAHLLIRLPRWLSRAVRGKSYAKAEAIPLAALPLEGVDRSISHGTGTIVFCRPMEMTAAGLAASYGGTSALGLGVPYYLDMSGWGRSIPGAELARLLPLALEAAGRGESRSDTELELRHSAAIPGTGRAQTISRTEARPCSTGRFSSFIEAGTTATAESESREAEPLGGVICESGSYTDADMEYELGDWLWPIEDGEDVYIRQTYYITENGTDLYLGA